MRICADCRGVLSDCVTTEATMFHGNCPTCGSQEMKPLYALRSWYLSSAIEKIRAREQQIPKAWWDRLREYGHLYEVVNRKHLISVMDRIERGE